MKLIPLFIISILTTGCTHAPIKMPSAADAFTQPSYSKDLNPESLAIVNASTMNGYALRLAEASDQSANFNLDIDTIAALLLTAAGVGVLSNAHSDFYKATGALMGLTLGTKQYFQAGDQRAVYLNSAESASCSAAQLGNLAGYLDGISDDDIRNETNQAKQANIVLKAYIYSPVLIDSQATPFSAATLVNAAVNAENDMKSKLDALRFLKNITDITHQRKIAIFKYATSEIYKTSYNLDESLKVISRLSVSPTDLLHAYNGTKPKTENLLAQAQFTEGQQALQPSLLAQRLPDIIESINAFNTCTVSLKPLTH